MVRLVKLNPEEKLRAYIRSKYMSTADRITEDRDWKDGINQFRLRTHRDLEQIFKELDSIRAELKIFTEGNKVV
jgi:hypothetical protein